MKPNKESGTTLDMLRVLSLKSNNSKDFITYQYEWKSGNHGPYEAYIPKGQTNRLGLKVGYLYRIETSKINGIYNWVSSVQLEMKPVELEKTKTILEEFFYE